MYAGASHAVIGYNPPQMNANIILIGPIGCGKSTVSELLSQWLDVPRRSMDELRWYYYDEIGYDHSIARQKYIEERDWGLYRYWKSFEAHAVERILSDFSGCVIDFGAGNTVYDDEELFGRVRRALSPHPAVVLLLPSPDVEESIRILRSRNRYLTDVQHEINQHFVRHRSNYDLAKVIVYTKDRTPEQTADEVLRWVRDNVWTNMP
jgi:shikimate kinase